MSAALPIERVEVLELVARFEDLYGGLNRVPEWVLRPAAHFRSSPRLGQSATLVLVHAGGLVGVGEAYGLPDPAPAAAVVTSLLAPRLIGGDALQVERTWQACWDAGRGLGSAGGFFAEAVGGVDAALWDLRGKAMGQPVHVLLGGPARSHVPVYAGSVPLRRSVEESAEHACGFLAQGHRAVKVKVGDGVDRDLDHAAAIRAAVGDDVELLADANLAYGRQDATRLADGLADLRYGWLEEPLVDGSPRAMAELGAGARIPLAAGENLHLVGEALELLRHRGVDVLTPNVARVAGITGARRIAALADAFGVEVAPHGVGSAVNVAAALQVAASVAHLRAYEHNQLRNPLRDDLAGGPLRVEDGHVAVPEGPGLGITLDQETVTRYLRRRTVVPAA